VDKVHFILEKKKEKILHFSFSRLTRRTHYSADDVDDDDNNSHHSAAVLLLQKGISTLNDRTEGERERERERELHLACLLLLLFVKQEFRYF
jgi:hypothetical protein